MITIKEIKENVSVQEYIKIGNSYLGKIGAIEHNCHHAELTSSLCFEILTDLGYPKREAELAEIAGYLHDVGNLLNRYGHGLSGAIMAFQLLLEMGMDPDEIATIISAIGNHEEHSDGQAVNNVAAVLILADKSDVNRSRVRKKDFANFTKRDRVNYAVTHSKIKVNTKERIISLVLEIDTEVCSVMEYFTIFLTKMLMCQKAAKKLDCNFELRINNVKLL